MRVVLSQYTAIVVLVLVVLLLFGLYLSWTATRLDRLHVRLDAARVALDAQLVRRSAATLELARSGLLDVATAVILATAAREAQIETEDEREQAESALTRDLRAAFDDPVQLDQLRQTPEGTDLLQELGASMRRVQLARRFHNESVRAVRQIRGYRRVRYFRLAGRAPDKPTFEIDDEPPTVFIR
jgi:sensor histidine kinase regulating citrate/malate metabolism